MFGHISHQVLDFERGDFANFNLRRLHHCAFGDEWDANVGVLGIGKDWKPAKIHHAPDGSDLFQITAKRLTVSSTKKTAGYDVLNNPPSFNRRSDRSMK